ncbi:type III pantothenate kinase [Intestinibacillus sp. Marseille-P6563]|uniref:type III pantothenate kinase n=1 Tax=Intestinibacillus sp. Marseille-P6563 TaxID=2364792 RepID=UPI000F056FEB|nr:type III pantothenate kinase [Intestinibacillus sp. Marseille-P6563]
MLLTIDVGNTNMVFGLFEKKNLVGTFRMSTDATATSDEIGLKILQYYHFRGLDAAKTSAVIIASVVPPAMYSLINAIRKYLRLRPLVVGTDVDPGMVNLYTNPREVGVDRLVNGVSAVARYGKPLIIVDIGTAITFDAIDQNGAYLGGAIFPGIKVAMEALFMKASKLPRVDIAATECAIGRTTVQSMQSGAVRGYVGALTGIIEDMKKELEGDVRVIATGGMGRMMAEHCPLIDEVDSNLTLDGLRMIYEQNRALFREKCVCHEDSILEATEES